MPKTTSYYIASGLENAPKVRELKAILDAAGCEHTYDWTVHGSVQKEGAERIAAVAAAESRGVLEGLTIIVLLPGGRGTHTELGMAIGQAEMFDYFAQNFMPMLGVMTSAKKEGRRIVVFSPDPEKDFGTGGTTCAFYHHPLVERFDDMDKMIASLLEENP